MKRKSLHKLTLNRESLHPLDPGNLREIAGGLNSTSENCTQQCTNPPRSDGGHSFCFCPQCQTFPC